MASRSTIPDAWDDDYEAIVDSKPASKAPSNPSIQPKMSRAERKAQHEEANKQLWESAENPETFHFVEAKNNVPLKSDFKPALRVLSRKPQTTNPAPTASNVANGVQGMSLQDDDDDSEEEARKAQERSLAERQEKAAREREEKQRKYAEVRERLFGSTSPAPDGSDSPPGGISGRSRPRGGKKRSDGTSLGSQPTSSADQSPARAPAPARQLYDPNEPSKPRPSTMDRSIHSAGSTQERPIRNPRGPDGSGRGGFGFAPRGNKTNPA